MQAPDERGRDLLPLNPLVIDTLPDLDEGMRASLKLLLHVLNFMSMGCRNNRKADLSIPTCLSTSQKLMLDHLSERLTDLAEEPYSCEPLQESSLMLGKARFDYAGEPVHPMEDLVAEKVIPVWPKPGECAVQSVMDFLPPGLAEMMEDPMNSLLLSWEWPDQPAKSRVRATQDEWNKIVSAAHVRGLMVPVEADQVFRDHKGNMVLNGAGAVRKLKRIGGEELVMQRFISNFIPSNAYQAHIDAGDRYLPYLGQLTLLEQSDEECFLVDSEDVSSCFNLFKLPDTWLPLMCFEKTVDAKLFNGTPGEQVYAAMAVVPMGWINAVTVIQSVVRTLVFQGAEVPEDTEVTKVKGMPDNDDLTVIYLDSYDELRRLDKQCAEVLEGQPSARHRRFRAVCKEKGLPLNDAKRLIGATKGTLQGGTLDGLKGWYKLGGEKQVSLISLGAALLTLPSWKEFEVRDFIGKATFGMCFRRPLMSIFDGIFRDLGHLIKNKEASPRDRSVDEVIMVIATTCLMGSSLRVRIDREISCSDASPTGGGGAVATEFMPEPATVMHNGDECWVCDEPFRSGQRYPCPCLCGAAFCSLECIWRHRHGDASSQRTCMRRGWKPPKFGERFSGPHAPLSHAVAKMGGIEIQEPFDKLLGSDMFTEEGREELTTLMSDPHLYCEHSAPECKLFSKARGRPITSRWPSHYRAEARARCPTCHGLHQPPIRDEGPAQTLQPNGIESLEKG